MRALSVLLLALLALPVQAQGTVQAFVNVSSGESPEGIEVDFYAPASTDPAFSGISDAAGVVIVENVPEGTYAPYVELDTGFYTQGVLAVATTDGDEANLFVDAIDPERAIVTGTVRDGATDTPIDEVIGLFLFEGEAFSLTATLSGPGGRYAFQAPAGDVDVQTVFLQAPTDGEEPLYFETGEVIPLSTSPGEVLLLDFDLRVLETGTVSGQVVADADGAPTEGAFLSFSSPNSVLAFTAQTDADGRYELVVPEGDYTIEASASGFVSEFYDDVYRISDATPVTITANGATSGIDFSLANSATSPVVVTVEGTIRDADTNAPIAGALVDLYYPGLSPYVPFASTTTAADGTYTVEADAGVGAYFGIAVAASAEGFEERFYASAETVFEADILTPSPVSNETLSGIDIGLPEDDGSSSGGFALSGRVAAEQGASAIENAFVIASNLETGEAYLGVSGSDGAYEIRGIPAGDYVVLFAADEYAPEYYNGRTDWTQADVVSVSGDVIGLDALLGGLNRPVAGRNATEPSIEGQVLFADGSPAARSLVTARQADGSIAAFALADASGVYSLHGVSGVSGTVQVSAPLYEVEDVAFSLSGPVATSSVLSFDLVSAVAVSTGSDTPEASGDELSVYPNPTRGQATVAFSLAQGADVRVAVIDMLGREVATVASGARSAGAYTEVVDTARMAPGLYLVRVETPEGARTARFTVIR